MPIGSEIPYDEQQLEMLCANAEKRGLTVDEYLVHASTGAEQAWADQQAKRGGVVLPFVRRNA